jgi:hypothetical protein
MKARLFPSKYLDCKGILYFSTNPSLKIFINYGQPLIILVLLLTTVISKGNFYEGVIG